MNYEVNILEKIKYILNLDKNKEFNKNFDMYLDAASTEEEYKTSRNALLNIIAGSLYSEYYNVIREQPNGEELLSELVRLSRSGVTDQEFENILKKVEFMIKPFVNKNYEKVFDTRAMRDLAEKISSFTAISYIDEYAKTRDVKELILSMEQIIDTIVKKAVLAREDRKISKSTQVYIDGLYDLLRNIKKYVDLGDEKNVHKGLGEFTKLSNKAFKSINNTDTKDIESKGSTEKNKKGKSNNVDKKNKLSVVVTDGLSKFINKNKLSNFKLNKTPKKGKTEKPIKYILLVTGFIAVVIGGTWYFISNSDKKDEKGKTKLSTTSMFDVYNGVVIGDKIGGASLIFDDVTSSPIPTSTPIPADEDAKSTPVVEPTVAPNDGSLESPKPQVTPDVKPAVTPASTVTPQTPEPTVEPTPTIDPNESKVSEAAYKIYNNWGMFTGYGYDDIEMAIRTLNGLESSMSVDEVCNMLSNVLNTAVVPGVQNALYGESNATYPVSLTDMLIFNQEGRIAVNSMELNLNGALTDLNNLAIYGERTITEEAIIINGGVSGGVGINSGDPAARLLWAMLSANTNPVINALGSDYSITLDGVTYTINDINNVSVYDAMIQSAKQELSSQKTM